MNKKIIILAVVASIIIISILFAIFFRLSDNKTYVENETAISTTILIRDKISQYSNSSKLVDTVIPEFQNLEDEFERTINLKIHKELDEIEVYKKATEGLSQDEIGFFTYETSYDRYNCGKYISVVADQYIHIGNGRPRIQKKCYVINAETNATMTLMDVFENKLNYKKNIIAEINKQAIDKNLELMGGNGLTQLDDEQAFYIKDNKIIIYFEASEIAATAVGELEFEMPFEMKEDKFI